jgi:fucose permease
MTVLAIIGEAALYLLYGWLLSAIVASYLSGKKGYGERLGLASGLLLTVVGVLIWLLMPAKPTSDWGRRKAARTSGD